MDAWVYMMSNKRNGTLYIGVTTNIAGRAWQHRDGVIAGFTQRYGLSRLVYVEAHASVSAAIQRERTLKHWKRAWKIALIEQGNPDWADLYERVL